MKNKYNLRIVSFLLTVCLLCLANRLEAAAQNTRQKKKIAVMAISTENTAAAFAPIIRHAIEMEFYATDTFQLLEREHIDRVHAEYPTATSAITYSDDMIELGKTLTSDFIVTGSIRKLEQYKLSVRVISVRDGKIITAYAREFDEDSEIDRVINRIASNIARDITIYVRKGYVKKRVYDFNNIYLDAGFQYIVPQNSFKKLVNPGYGMTCGARIEGLLLDQDLLGFTLGHYRFNGSINTDDHIYITFLTFHASYRFYLVQRFHVEPYIESGPAIVQVQHGQGNGFKMEENTETSAIEPMIASGINLGIMPVYDLLLEAGFSYGTVFEEDDNMDFLRVMLRISYAF